MTEKLGRSIVSKKKRQIAFEMNCSFIVHLLKSVFYSYTSENEQTGLLNLTSIIGDEELKCHETPGTNFDLCLPPIYENDKDKMGFLMTFSV